jgi:hypothetical protein
MTAEWVWRLLYSGIIPSSLAAHAPGACPETDIKGQ